MSDRDGAPTHVSDASMCVLASCTAVGAWIGGHWPAVAIVGAVGLGVAVHSAAESPQ